MSEIVVGEPVGEPVRADGCDGAQGRAEPFGPLGKGERLALEDVGSGVLEGYCHAGRAPERAYGGSVVGQALAAAYRSVDDDRSVHSLHAYFLRAVSPERPVRYESDAVRDGRSYSMRQVTAKQDGKDVLTMSVSFKLPQHDGSWRQPGMPDVPGPEGLDNGFAFRPVSHPLRTAVEFRQTPPVLGREDGQIERFGWFRSVGALPDDPALRAGALAYISDAPLAPTALVPYGEPRPAGIVLASLDHAMWFHRAFRADEWLLYACRSRLAGDGRTLAYGDFWNRDGQLVASVAQEALLRIREA
ncbi:thioesterase family protein [Streptomyces sp. NBC_01378]|uniref:acyl-CoA thioesterase n=1 Tax=Streptomyces sp. NBC_01378 TaxID=2903844 RepID=UPI0032485B12